MSHQRLIEVAQHRTPLQTTRLHHRQQPLHERGAGVGGIGGEARFEFGDAAFQRRDALVALQTSRTSHHCHDTIIANWQARSCGPKSSNGYEIWKRNLLSRSIKVREAGVSWPTALPIPF